MAGFSSAAQPAALTVNQQVVSPGYNQPGSGRKGAKKLEYAAIPKRTPMVKPLPPLRSAKSQSSLHRAFGMRESRSGSCTIYWFNAKWNVTPVTTGRCYRNASRLQHLGFQSSGPADNMANVGNQPRWRTLDLESNCQIEELVPLWTRVQQPPLPRDLFHSWLSHSAYISLFVCQFEEWFAGQLSRNPII